ncbi:hypothetical protein GIB67_032926 [Kingdonia uniflora]|uniref:Peptidase metallopeptidase domain-containing protein n=1 Tax=Kingdonia uniflora TaxID=39325 RepID=A0A7J7MYJ8_9MAGN|nr:hypothetical protein GIB67_032926 [Kingdonia uniflora]
MVPKVSFLIVFILVLLPFFCYGTKPKSFEFLQQLQGCHKGENVQGLHDLKQYLKKFGYSNYPQFSNLTHEDDDNFDEFLESAIKTYQLNYHLKATGNLDSETVKTMMKPRCGVPDIINGTTSMRSGKEHHHNHDGIHTISHYSFFQGSPRWPASKDHLTYAFLPGASVEVLSPICASAFAKWSSVTHFSFEEILDYNTADIKIGVYSGDHGDGTSNSFDGRGGILAHAFAPTDGRFHYDGDELWANGPLAGYYDLETVALHEIGHVLGLEHSSVEGAIMFPSIQDGVRKELHDDDVQGIHALYGI